MTLGGTFNVDVNSTPVRGSTAAANTIGMGDAILSATVKEDLGGGMNIAANTTLQTKAGRGGTVTGNGYSLAFNTANAGSVTLSNYLNGGAGLSAGISATQDMNHIVAAYNYRNRLNYALPEIVKGLSLQVRYDTTDNSASPASVNLKDQTVKYAAQYTTGPVSAGFTGSKTDSFDAWNVSYDFGVAKAAVYRTNPLAGTAARTEMTVVAPFGATTVGLHTITGAVKGQGLVVSYALSKRTVLSANFVKQTTGADSTWDGKSNTRVRLSHTF